MYQVICFGEILWDNLPSGKKPGGAPLNVALHLSKHGIAPFLVSSVGDDSNGRQLLDFISSNGLPTNHIQYSTEVPTGVVEVQLDEEAQATYEIMAPVAWDYIRIVESNLALARQASAIVFGSLACRLEVSRETLLSFLDQSYLKVFDMNLRPPHYDWPLLEQLMTRCDILKINEYELQQLAESYNLSKSSLHETLTSISQKTNTKTICVTLGEHGAAIYHENSLFEHPGFKVKVADTVGAGDAFLATFLAGYLVGKPLDRVLAEACAAGAIVASREGANPAYNLSEILTLAGS